MTIEFTAPFEFAVGSLISPEDRPCMGEVRERGEERRGASPSGKKVRDYPTALPLSLSRETPPSRFLSQEATHPSRPVPPFVPSVNLFSPNPIMWVGASPYDVHAEGL